MSVGDLAVEDRRRLFDVLAGPHGRVPDSQNPVDILVVFGCAEADLAIEAARLFAEGVVRHVVFSGGVGKDSGDLAALGIAEADYLASVAIAEGLPGSVISIERDAANGAQNAALSLRLALKLGILPNQGRVASLASRLRSRRLFEELRFQAAQFAPSVDITAGLASGGPIDPLSVTATQESLAELRGLNTMHEARPPRIFLQPEFQEGGLYEELIRHIPGVAPMPTQA